MLPGTVAPRAELRTEAPKNARGELILLRRRRLSCEIDGKWEGRGAGTDAVLGNDGALLHGPASIATDIGTCEALVVACANDGVHAKDPKADDFELAVRTVAGVLHGSPDGHVDLLVEV